MNLSYTTGHQVVGEKGQVSFHHHDSYIVQNDIKNSPSFMKKKKSELLATLDNFGPFHWFFTLRCADRRWLDIWSAILRELPDITDIQITKQKKKMVSSNYDHTFFLKSTHDSRRI